jgi:hypothetical protein
MMIFRSITSASAPSFWLTHAHAELVAGVLKRLAICELQPAAVLNWAGVHGIKFEAAIEFLSAHQAFSKQLQNRNHHRLAVSLGLLLEKFKALRQSSEMVQSELRWTGPVQRPHGYRLDDLPPAKLVRALRTTETNSYPVSDMRFAPAFATPLFETAARVLEALGTSSLTMAEMARLIASNVDWHDRTTAVVRDRRQFKLTPETAEALHDAHELHWIMGLRDIVGRGEIAPGLGGEAGLFARLTDVNNEFGCLKAWGLESEIFNFWERSLQRDRAQQKSPTSRSTRSPAERLAADGYLQVHARLSALARSGALADPREEAVLKPWVKTLLRPGAAANAREAAAANLMQHLLSRKKLLEVVSASSAVAEIHFLQTLYRFVKARRINFNNPHHAIDWADVHGFYVNLLEQGQLTTLHTVLAWLEQHQVPHRP